MNQKYKEFFKKHTYGIAAITILCASVINDLSKPKVVSHPMPTWLCIAVIVFGCFAMIILSLDLYLSYLAKQIAAQHQKNSAERLTAIQALDAADVTVAKSLRDFARLCVFPSNSVVMGDDVNRQISEFMNGITTIIETKKMPPEKEKSIAPKNLN